MFLATHASFHKREIRQRLAVCFFFNHTATTEVYTLSLHDALPILAPEAHDKLAKFIERGDAIGDDLGGDHIAARSEEHTSELQSHSDLVCRLLLEKKKGAIDASIWSRADVTTGAFAYLPQCPASNV